MDDATQQVIRESALRLLGLPEVEHAPDGIEVVATVLETREPDKAMNVGIGRVLAERARQVMAEKSGGRTPSAVFVEKVDSSDHANDCEDIQGRRGNAFIRGDRCYRIVLRLVFRD